MAQEEITPSPQAAQATPITPTETALPAPQPTAPAPAAPAAPAPTAAPTPTPATPAPATIEQAGQQAGVSVPPSPGITPQQVYSAENVKQATTEPAKAPDYSKLSVDELAKEIAAASSAAEVQQANIMNRRIAQGVNVGQAAHEARLATARINALSGLKAAKEQELARKQAEEERDYQRKLQEEQLQWQREDRELAKQDRQLDRQMKQLEFQAKKASLSQQQLAKGASPVIAKISQLEQQFGKGEWGKIAEQLSAEGFDVGSGSEADIELNRRYNPENYQRIIDEAKGGGTQGKDFTKTLQLSSAFRAEQPVKDYRTAENAYRKIQSAAQSKTPAGDISLIFSYMKVLDPNSTVREGEFATAQNAAGIPTQIVNAYNKAREGTRLSDDQRDDFVAQAGSLLDSYRSAYDNTVARYNDIAGQFGINPQLIISGNIAGMSALQSTSSADEWLNQSIGSTGAVQFTPEEENIYSQFGL